MIMMSNEFDDMEEKLDEGDGLIPQEKVKRPSGLRGIVESVAHLYTSSKINGSSTKLLETAAAAEEDLERLQDTESTQQHHYRPRRSWGGSDFRNLVPSLKAFILAVFFFGLGVAVACGLGLVVPYSSLLHLFTATPGDAPELDAFGLPDVLPVVHSTQLINKTELDLATGFVASQAPTIRSYEFNITYGLAAPDGVWKPMLLANGQSPGPLIEASTGDTVRVTVNNLLPGAETTTSLHFHGLNQYNTTWMDGVAGVSQCGIPGAGGTWTYEFVVAGGQRGTFWWHAHTSVQLADGLYGPIVVHGGAAGEEGEEGEGEAEELVPAAAAERILFLGENYHSLAAELAAAYLSPSTPWAPDEAGVEPLADNLLLNGQNTYDCGVASTTFTSPRPQEKKQADVPACTGGQAYETTIQPGATMRLRLINHSSYFSYWFSIDGHELSIVEMDGVEVEPIPVRGVHANIGQRYSVMVTADQAVGEYVIRSALEKDCFLPFSTYTSAGLESIGYEARGILRYEGAVAGRMDLGANATTATTTSASSKNTTTNKNTNPQGCYDMPFDVPRPRRPETAYELAEADPQYAVDFQFRQVGEVNRIFINRTSWAPYRDDAMLWQAVEQEFVPGEGGSYNNWGFRLDQQVLLVPDGSGVVQVAINSLDVMEHPFHMQ